VLRRLAAVVAMLVAMLVAAGPSAAAAGSVGIRLVDVPVTSANDPRAREYIVDNLQPGTVIQRRVEIANSTADTLRVALYPDSATIVNGAFIGGPGHSVNELTGWTSLSQTSIDVAAGGAERETVTISVPADASPGERYAVVWAEVTTADSGTVTQVSRTGIRIYLSVSGNNPPASAFTIDTVTAQRDATGRPIVLAQVHNTGGRALDMAGTLALAAVTGAIKAGPYPAVLGITLAPGQTQTVKFAPDDDLTDGPWNATITLHSGLTEGSATAKITFPHGTGNGTAVATSHHSSRAPWVAIVIGVAVVLIALMFLWVVLRRRRSAAEPSPGSATTDRS
jgi:hypothetical protein